MRARYYSPEMRRFINADILHGEISDSTSLNRYSYVNGNPVSFVDPFGLSAERGQGLTYNSAKYNNFNSFWEKFKQGFLNFGKWLDVLAKQIDEFTDKYYIYDRDAAIAYAKKWAGNDSFFDKWFNYIGETRNPEYYSYSNNCANFVSQCLYSGGITMNEDWHSYKEFNTNKHLLDIRSTVSSNYWYDWDITGAWRLAKEQYNFFSDPDNGYINGDVIEIKNVDDIPHILDNYDIQKGDLLYWSHGDEDDISHASMISNIKDNMILYTANTRSRFDYRVDKSFASYSAIYIVRINNYIEK